MAKLLGVNGQFIVDKVQGVFVTLLMIKDGLPVRCGFKEWNEACPESLRGNFTYSYGEIKTHKKNVINFSNYD